MLYRHVTQFREPDAIGGEGEKMSLAGKTRPFDQSRRARDSESLGNGGQS